MGQGMANALQRADNAHELWTSVVRNGGQSRTFPLGNQAPTIRSIWRLFAHFRQKPTTLSIVTAKETAAKPTDDIDVRRVRVFSVITCISLATFLVYRLLTGHIPAFLVILVASAIAGVGLFFSLRGARPRLTAHLTFIGASVSVGGTQIQDGRIESTSLWVISVIPFVAGHILGRSAIVGYTMFASFFIVFAMWGESWGFVPPDQFTPEPFSWINLRVVSLMGILVVGIQMARDNRARIRNAAEKMLEREKSHRQALEYDKEKALFLKQMAREIRGPMNGIKGISQYWRETAAAPEPRESVEVIDRCADRLMSMIQDIQDISKIEQGEIQISREPFSINLAISDVSRLFQAKAESKGLLLEVHGPTKEHWVVGDAQRLVQILANLVGNAIKFSDRGRIVIAWSQAQDQRYRFEVKDQGIGMSSEQLANLFERYHQVNLDQGVIRGGTGLGLTISKALSETMGGSLTASSQEGEGSTFALDLDIEAATEIPQTRTPSPSIVQAPAKLSILVLDQDETSFFVLQLGLQRLGSTPTRCTTPAQALALGQTQAFDLLIFDLHTLDRQGFEFVDTFRQTCVPNASTPIVAITAERSSATITQCSKAGIVELLVKPLSAQALARGIECAKEAA